MVKIDIEQAPNSTSTSIVWGMLATPEGMARWLADTVTQDGDTLTFTWGSPYDHHEMRRATILEKKKNRCIRFAWDDERTLGTFVEIRMEKSPLTGEYSLHITDFSTPDDREWLLDTWGHNFRQLRRSSGL